MGFRIHPARRSRRRHILCAFRLLAVMATIPKAYEIWIHKRQTVLRPPLFSDLPALSYCLAIGGFRQRHYTTNAWQLAGVQYLDRCFQHHYSMDMVAVSGATVLCDCPASYPDCAKRNNTGHTVRCIWFAYCGVELLDLIHPSAVGGTFLD